MASRPVSFEVFIFIGPLYEKFLTALICCTFMRCADFENGSKICVLRPRSDLYTNRAFSHDVMAAKLAFQNNKTAAMLVFQENTLGVELFSLTLSFVPINLHRCWPRGWKRSMWQSTSVISWKGEIHMYNLNLFLKITTGAKILWNHSYSLSL